MVGIFVVAPKSSLAEWWRGWWLPLDHECAYKINKSRLAQSSIRKVSILSSFFHRNKSLLTTLPPVAVVFLPDQNNLHRNLFC